MPSAIANGVDLYYEAHGHGPVILGVHGSPSSAVLWESAATRLGTLGTCIVYDRRGYGRSTAPEPFETTDLDDQVADAAALLDRLGGVFAGSGVAAAPRGQAHHQHHGQPSCPH